MAPLLHRLFWSLVLVLQLALVAACATGALGSFGLGRSTLYTLPLQIAYGVPLLLLVLQKPFMSHNFWAGFFGVSVASLLLGTLALSGSLGSGLSAPVAAILATMFALQLICVFGQFILVYASPYLWCRT